jgi:hypothetical protein
VEKEHRLIHRSAPVGVLWPRGPKELHEALLQVQVDNVAPHDRVQSVRRLVQDEQLGPLGQR